MVNECFDFVIWVGPQADNDLVMRHIGDVTAGLYQKHSSAGQARRVFSHPNELEGVDAGLLHSDDVRRSTLTLTRGQTEEQSCSVRPRLIVLNPWLLVDAARDSGLVVVLPRFVGEQLVEAKTLEPVLPDWDVVDAPVRILHPARRYQRPVEKACIDFVASRLREAVRVNSM